MVPSDNLTDALRRINRILDEGRGVEIVGPSEDDTILGRRKLWEYLVWEHHDNEPDLDAGDVFLEPQEVQIPEEIIEAGYPAVIIEHLTFFVGGSGSYSGSTCACFFFIFKEAPEGFVFHNPPNFVEADFSKFIAMAITAPAPFLSQKRITYDSTYGTTVVQSPLSTTAGVTRPIVVPVGAGSVYITASYANSSSLQYHRIFGCRFELIV